MPSRLRTSYTRFNICFGPENLVIGFSRLRDGLPPPPAGSPMSREVRVQPGFRLGSVMAMTPAMTQTNPIHAVPETVCPRNATPMATPIGTRR